MNELYHHGILGQKWGVRRYQNKDGSLTAEGKQKKAENYSEQQRTRDRKIYGNGAENRINKRMLNGESIQSARHNEVKRKERIESGKELVKRIAKGALVVGGAAAVAKVLQKNGFGNRVASEVMANEIDGVGRKIINGIFK